uniref:Uncharacterized protein n=1 Tax=Anopheles atroparvus TaxID=41427 RepID=A0A182IP78_ANOAO
MPAKSRSHVLLHQFGDERNEGEPKTDGTKQERALDVIQAQGRLSVRPDLILLDVRVDADLLALLLPLAEQAGFADAPDQIVHFRQQVEVLLCQHAHRMLSVFGKQYISASPISRLLLEWAREMATASRRSVRSLARHSSMRGHTR